MPPYSPQKKRRKKAAPTPKSTGGSKRHCPICMDKVGMQNGFITLACRHSYCRTCLATHHARQQRHEQPPTCPLCKRECSGAEVEACGEAKKMEEDSESEDELDGGVMVLVEFEGEDGEQGYWIEFNGAELDDSDEDDLYGEDGSDDEQDMRHIFIEEDAEHGEPSSEFAAAANEEGWRAVERRRRAARRAERRAALLEGMLQVDENQEEEGEDEEVEEDDDPRPYGGWRWSASHNAWVGGTHCSRPPPVRAPAEGEWEATGLRDPLEGRWLVAEEDVQLMEAAEEAELLEEEQEYWQARGQEDEL